MSRTARLVPAAAVLLVALTSCGGSPGTGAAADSPAPPASASEAPVDPTLETAPPATGALFAGLRLSGPPVTDGTAVVALAGADEAGPARAVAAPAAPGGPSWAAPLPVASGATAAEPTLLAAPGAPILVSFRQDSPGAGLTPAGATRQVVALDPLTGTLLWQVDAGGPAAAAGAAAVLVAVGSKDDPAGTTLALDPRTGERLWTDPAGPVAVHGPTAVLSRADKGVSTIVTGADAATGKALWSSGDWSPGAFGSRTTVLASLPGRLVAETKSETVSGTARAVRLRDLRTGRTVGPALPAVGQVSAVADPAGKAFLVGDDAPEAEDGVRAVDAATGQALWRLAPARTAGVLLAGAGVSWLQGVDGAVAVGTRDGKPRAQGLPGAPVAVLPGVQLLPGADGGLTPAPLP